MARRKPATSTAPSPAPGKKRKKPDPAREAGPAPPRPARRRATLRITRVYTRAGDGGTTRLVGGQELPKHHPRIEAYGSIDELGAWIGWARAGLDAALAPLASAPDAAGTGARARATSANADAVADLRAISLHLRYVQNLLFTVGGDLATRIEDRWPDMPLVNAGDVAGLERLIDACNESLPPLTDFILAGGPEPVLRLHACRTNCRRAERAISALAALEPVGEHVGGFVNRLSDLLFVLARYVDARLREAGIGGPETIWDRGLEAPPLPKRRGGAVSD